MSNNLTNEYAAWLSENQEEVDHSAHVANLEKHYGTDQFQQYYDAVGKLSAHDKQKIANVFTNRKTKSGKEAMMAIHAKHHNIVDADQFKAARGGRVA